VLFGCGVGENDEVRGTLFRLPVKKEGVGHRPLISELESRSDEESDGEHTTHSRTHDRKARATIPPLPHGSFIYF